MNKPDHDGLILCRMQGRIFELSLSEDCSSAVFIRRFMNSDVAGRMDELFFLETSQSERQAVDEIRGSYERSYGSGKFEKEELYWMGYLYRYWAYCTGLRSFQIYRICNATELRKRYYLYHTLSPEMAIERIMEEKGYIPVQTEEEKYLRSRKLVEEKIRSIE